MAAQNEVSIRINADGTAVVTGVKKIEDQVNQSTFRIKDAWLKLGAVMASTAFLQSAAKDALAAEQAATKLKFQIESLGVSYTNTSGAIQDAINKTSEYARVQDDEAAKTLQALIFNSGKYKESLENLNLVYDLAYQKGMSAEESASLIGKAMTGNAEMLGRYIPELRNLEQTLGKNATEAQKSAYAMIVLKEKTEGAMQAMGEHEKTVRESVKAYQDFEETVGRVVVAAGDILIAVFNAAAAAVLQMYSGLMWVGAGVAKLTDALGISKGAFESWKLDAIAAKEAAVDLAGKSQEGAIRAFSYALSLKEQAAATKKATGAANEYAKAVKKESDEIDAKKEKTKEAEEQAKREAEIYEQAEAKILSVVIAEQKMGASKERLMELESLEYSLQGASVEQIERYQAALQQKADTEAQIAAQKEQEQAKKALSNIGPAPDVMGESDVPQQFDEAAQMQERLDAIAAFYTEKIRLQIEAGETQEQINATMGQAQLAHDNQVNQLRLAQAQGTFAMMANMMQNLYAASGQKNKAAFQAMKAFAIAETTINTIRSAQSVFAGMTAMIPGPVGIAMGAAAAAAAVAAGMARVQQISSMNPGGATATISAEGNANPSYSGGSPSAYPAPERLEKKEEEQTQSKSVTIVVNGNIVDHAAFAREVAPYMEEAKGDKVNFGS